MLTYLFIAVTNAMLARGAYLLERKSGHLAIVVYLLTAILFAFFAGARSVDVGTDTKFYAVAYRSALGSDLWYFLSDSKYSSWAPFAKLLVWLASNMTNSLFGFYFILGFFVVFPTLAACRRILGSYAPYGIFIFGIIFYPMSFNMMRQSIAMSFLLLQYSCISKNKIPGSIALLLFAVSFHTTAILGLLLYPLCMYGGYRRLSLGLKGLFLIAISIAIVVASRQLMELFTAATGMYGSYTSWNTAAVGGGWRTLLEIWAIFGSISVLSLYSIRDDRLIRDGDVPRLVAIVLVGAVIFSLCLISFWFYRIGLYYIYFSILLIPMLARIVDGRESRRLFIGVATLLLVMFFLDYYVITLQHQVVPYEFASTIGI